MTDRPEDLQRRLRGLNQIGEVVGALRAIASGQSVAAHAAMAAISAHAATLTQAMAQARAQVAQPMTPPLGPGILLVVGAAQGFSGAYPTRLADAARKALAPGTALVVVGNRTLTALRDRGLPVQWSEDLPGHPATIPSLASRVTDALIRLAADWPGPIRALVGQHQQGQPPEIRRLFPPDLPPVSTAFVPPLTTLPPDALMSALLQEALFAATALALMQGIEAEASARVQAMARARTNLDQRRAEVESAYVQARQEQMTTEMIELASPTSLV